MFSVEREIVLVVYKYLAYFVVPFCALIIHELPSGYNFGRLGVLYPFLKLDIAMIID